MRAGRIGMARGGQIHPADATRLRHKRLGNRRSDGRCTIGALLQGISRQRERRTRCNCCLARCRALSFEARPGLRCAARLVAGRRECRRRRRSVPHQAQRSVSHHCTIGSSAQKVVFQKLPAIPLAADVFDHGEQFLLIAAELCGASLVVGKHRRQLAAQLDLAAIARSIGPMGNRAKPLEHQQRTV